MSDEPESFATAPETDPCPCCRAPVTQHTSVDGRTVGLIIHVKGCTAKPPAAYGVSYMRPRLVLGVSFDDLADAFRALLHPRPKPPTRGPYR